MWNTAANVLFLYRVFEALITVEAISTVEQYFFGQRKLDKIGVENLILNEKAILEMLINVQELVCCRSAVQ